MYLYNHLSKKEEDPLINHKHCTEQDLLLKLSKKAQGSSTSFSWLQEMFSMAIGLLGALFPAEGTSCDGQGEGRGCTAPADWHCTMLGGDGWTIPAAAWTACLGANVLDRYSFTCCL